MRISGLEVVEAVAQLLEGVELHVAAIVAGAEVRGAGDEGLVRHFLCRRWSMPLSVTMMKLFAGVSRQ